MSDVRQRLLRRIGAARVVLEQAKNTCRHATLSLVQKEAVVELIADAMANRSLDAQDIALITDRVLEVSWANTHCDEILNAVSSTTKNKRRKGQDYKAAVSYLTQERWDTFMSEDLDLNAKSDHWLEFVSSLDCINPTEPTLKYWTSCTLVANFGKLGCQNLSLQSKYALKHYVKTEFDKLTRRKLLNGQPAVYLQKLPPSPATLQRDEPAMFQRLFSHGLPVKSRLDQTVILEVDATFQCRGGTSKCTTMALAPSPSAEAGMGQMASFIPMLMQGIAQMINNNNNNANLGSGGLTFGGNNRPPAGAKRSFKELGQDPADYGDLTGNAPPRRVPMLGDGSALPRGRAGFNRMPTIGPDDGEPVEISTGGSSGALAEPPEGQHPTDDGSEVGIEEQDVGDVMLEAILKRDQANKLIAADKKRKEKLEKAAAAGAAAAGDDAAAAAAAHIGPMIADATSGGLQLQACSAKRPAANTGKEKPDAKRKSTGATPEAKPVDTGAAKPGVKLEGPKGKASLSHERSRFQYLGRTGVVGDRSVKFTYPPQKHAAQYASEDLAKKAAHAWLKALQARNPK